MDWISVEEKLPPAFVSVLAYMPDAEPFPQVREAYTVGGRSFYFPCIKDIHRVTHWAWMPEPPKEESTNGDK